MTKPTYTSIGDVGIDIYPKQNKRFPSGTALNSAYYAIRDGAISSVISAVGTDKEAQVILDFMKRHGISADLIEQIKGKTDLVEIFLDKKGRPRYENWDLGVLGKYRLSSCHKNFLKTQDIAVAIHYPEVYGMFDDFAKMELPDTIKLGDFADLSEYGGSQKIFEKYKNSLDIFALSIDEKHEERLASFEEFISKSKKIGIALLGERGSVIFHKNKKYVQSPIKTKVVDTTGAGDSYIATFIVNYFLSQNIQRSMQLATKIASKTIMHLGAIV